MGVDSWADAVDGTGVLRRLGTSVEEQGGMRRSPRSLLLVSTLLVACAVGDPDSLDGFGEVGDDDDASAPGSASTSGASESSSDGTTTDEGEPATDQRFDVPSPDAAGEGEPCGRVDLLFVIDNSGSMGDEQTNLVASFPGFIDGIMSILPSTDYQVGVITTDENDYNGLGCQHLGALTVATGGEMSSDAECGPYTAGRRYMSSADDLDHDFSCAAQVGIDGSGVERPMDAIAAALDPVAGNLGSCNAHFLRDEALLVIVLITDEEDQGDSVGDPADWAANVVEAKNGNEDQVVVLSLLGHDKPNACIEAQWTGTEGAEISPRLIEFTQSFGVGRVGDVCAGSYDQFFYEGIVGIADACNVVVPVG